MIRYGKYKIYTSTNFEQNQKITYKEISSFLKIKITLSKNEENKIENLTLTSGNINIIKKNHSIEINFIRENNQSHINLEMVFNCLIKLKEYAISHNQKIISTTPIRNIINKLRIIQMINIYLKIQVFLFESIPDEIIDPDTKHP